MSGRVSPGVVVLLIVLAGFALAAVGAPVLAPHDPLRQALLLRLRPPGTRTGAGVFLLGTDDLGRDLLSRIIYGARVSLAVAALSVSVSITVGTALGLLAGWWRGWVAVVVLRLVDIVLSVPAILLAVLTVAVIGPGFLDLVLVLGLTRWPRYARVAYAATLQVAGCRTSRRRRWRGPGRGGSWGGMCCRTSPGR